MTPAPGEDVFTADDLAPSEDERASRRRASAERALASLGALAAGFLAGGTVALGAAAAPSVFGVVPPPLAGQAMGAAFLRFDKVALGCALALLAVEIGRALVARGRASGLAARVRRLSALVLAAGVSLVAFVFGPTIQSLHAAGARRGEGEAGLALDAAHRKAELFGKLDVSLAILLVFLHVLTLPTPRSGDEGDEESRAPLPPGPA